MAAIAGADKVYAYTQDSRFGSKEEVNKLIVEEARFWGVNDVIEVVFDKDRRFIGDSDIITNSGFVRPITADIVYKMKRTAVIPLMWFANELRTNELDLETCIAQGVLVIGTDENHPSLKLLESSAFKICKLLFETGLSIWGNKLLLIGSGDACDYPHRFFIDNKIETDRISFDDKYDKSSYENIFKSLEGYDAIIVNEIHHEVDIISKDGFIPTEVLKEVNPMIKVIHIAGKINKKDILESGLELYPDHIRKFGYMSITSDYLGPICTFKLNIASLKIAEVASRCRIKGLSINETIKYAIKNTAAQALPQYLRVRKDI